MTRYSLGIDIGGTFTDIVVHDHVSGGQFSRKVLTTHDDPARGVIDGVALVLREHGLDPAAVQRTVHATTLFTNALIERKGAVTGLITTEGFRDTLEIGRERKYELYDLTLEPPAPLVPRDRRLEIAERITADGAVHRPLDEAGLVAAAQALIPGGAEGVAVIFLPSYPHPSHPPHRPALLPHPLPHH